MREDFIRLVNGLDKDELRELNECAVARLRFLVDQEQRSAAIRLAVGDEVSFETRTGEWIYGTILRINSKTVTIQTDRGKWRVWPTHVRRVVPHPGTGAYLERS